MHWQLWTGVSLIHLLGLPNSVRYRSASNVDWKVRIVLRQGWYSYMDKAFSHWTYSSGPSQWFGIRISACTERHTPGKCPRFVTLRNLHQWPTRSYKLGLAFVCRWYQSISRKSENECILLRENIICVKAEVNVGNYVKINKRPGWNKRPTWNFAWIRASTPEIFSENNKRPCPFISEVRLRGLSLLSIDIGVLQDHVYHKYLWNLDGKKY